MPPIPRLLKNQRSLLNSVQTSHICSNKRSVSFLNATINGYSSVITTATNPGLGSYGEIVFTGAMGPTFAVMQFDGMGECSRDKGFRFGRFCALFEVISGYTPGTIQVLGSLSFYNHVTPVGPPPAPVVSNIDMTVNGPGLYLFQQNPFSFISYDNESFVIPVSISVGVPFGQIIGDVMAVRSAWVEYI